MKKHQPRAWHPNPLRFMQPISKEARSQLVLRAYTALDAMTKSKLGGDKEAWRDLADIVNVTETMAAKLKMLPPEALGYTGKANEAMKAAQERYKAGKALRLDGVGIEAMRAVISLYDQALKLLTQKQVEEAFVTTQKEVERLIAQGAEAVSL